MKVSLGCRSNAGIEYGLFLVAFFSVQYQLSHITSTGYGYLIHRKVLPL